MQDMQNVSTDSVKMAKLKELLYNISRCDVFCDDRGESSDVPLWSTFHTKIQVDNQITVSTVAFNPIIMAPPTDYSTVYTTLKRMKECINALGQTYAPVYFDMGLLTKALEITWTKPTDMTGIIPCEGGMHLLMAVFAGIGHLYGDAGLRELLFESDVFAVGSVQQILSGKDFDKALRAFKLVDEALSIRFLIQFKRWCSKNNRTFPDSIHDHLHEFLEKLSDRESDRTTINDLVSGRLGEVVKSDLLPLLSEFREEGMSISPTFRFWNDFLVRVMLPFKLFLSSTRLGLWDVHQYAKAELLPLMFASNRSTYARYMSYQILQMQFPEDVINSFKEGLVAAKLS
ncbi:MAG: hypothetical protein AB2693_33625 [Candidatus Thiodiazotropha sp.]